MNHVSTQLRVVGVSVMFISCTLGATTERPSPWKMMRLLAEAQESAARVQPTTSARTLHFPQDRCIGDIYVKDAFPPRSINTYFYWTDLSNGDWQPFCPAVGDVTIGAGRLVRLSISAEQWRDLSPLDSLKPDDIYSLTISGPHQGGPRPTDAIIPHVIRLTGLKDLSLNSTALSLRGVSQLSGLKQLEYLTIDDIASDAAIEKLKSLPSLKGLFITENRLTNAGLAHLKDFPALEELALGQGRMTDKGLIHLAGCRRLYYLFLAGPNFTDYGMPCIKDIRSLRILHAGHLQHITDLGLKNVSTATQLERLSVHWADGITDDGLAHLTAMTNLRMVDADNAKITDKGAAHLSNIPTLQVLSVSGQHITDRGLASLSQLTNIRSLSVGRTFYVDPNLDSDLYGDLGIKQIAARCRQIEEISIGSIAMTNESAQAIATLPNLTKLTIFGAPGITGEGFACFSDLKSLVHLNLHAVSITFADLPHIRGLSNLETLHLGKIHRGNANLDLRGLTALENLSLSLNRRPPDYITDADLAGLTECKALKWLQIGPRRYSDEGMQYIAALPELERLGIGGPMLTDAGLEQLTCLKKLNHLSITDGQFTDRAVRNFSQMTALRYLFLPQSPAFDARAQQRLKSAMPNLLHLSINPPMR